MLRTSQILNILALIWILIIFNLVNFSYALGAGSAYKIFKAYYFAHFCAYTLSLIYSFLYKQHKVFWLGFLSFLSNIICCLGTLLLIYISTRSRTPSIQFMINPILFGLLTILNIIFFKSSIRRSWRR